MQSLRFPTIGFLTAALIITGTLSRAEDLDSFIARSKDYYRQAQETVRDMTVVRVTVIHAEDAVVNTEQTIYSKGEKSRIESTIDLSAQGVMPPGMEKMEVIVIDDGTDTWTISSMSGKRKVSGDEAMPGTPEIEHNWMDGHWLESLQESCHIEGSETVSGRDCHVIVDDSPEHEFNRLWLDKESAILVQIESRDDKGEVTRIINSDFRDAAKGYLMPYVTEIYSKDQLMATSTITSLKVNEGLSDDLFDPDKTEVPEGMNMQEMMQQMMQGREGD